MTMRGGSSPAAQFLAQPHRGTLREVTVEQHDVGVPSHDQALSRCPRVHGRHHFDVLLGLQPGREGIGKGSLLVDNEDANAHACERRPVPYLGRNPRLP